MAAPAVVYDISRLITRFSRPAPNGIDRVDIAYARHFFAPDRGGQAAVATVPGPRILSNRAADCITQSLARHWRDGEEGEPDANDLAVLAGLGVGQAAQAAAPQRSSSRQGFADLIAELYRAKALVGRDGLVPARNSGRAVPPGSIYILTSQFPLWIDHCFQWLDRRPDVRSIFFIHDLLPLTYPEFFPPAEARRHARRLEVAGRRAAAFIVATEQTMAALVGVLRGRGLPVPPVCVAPLPVSTHFEPGGAAPPPATTQPYFVTVGTVEPRKNHLLLLHIWRELAEKLQHPPKLVIVGARGWDNENVLDLVERCPRLRGVVIMAGMMSNPGLAQLLAGARALLMPTFAEGFGLPVFEAHAAGVSVVASDIPPFRRLCASIVLIDPLDGLAWRDEILALGQERAQRSAALSNNQPLRRGWPWHLKHIEEFISAL